MELPSLTPPLLHYLENCQGCGACAPSCPYYHVDPRYEPVEKAENLREIMRRHYTLAGRVLGKLVGARHLKDIGDLWRLSEYAYRCADCGHCYVTCPFAIDSGAVLKNLRALLFNSGVAPSILKFLSELEKEDKLMSIPDVASLWENFIKSLNAPVGVKGAEVFLMVSLLDVVLTPKVVRNTVKILQGVGENFTLPNKPLGVFPPVGGIVGDTTSMRRTIRNIVDYIEKFEPRKVVLINGCYTYPYFRFEATNILRKKFSFQVLHISELLDKYIKDGKLKTNKLNISATYYDSCQLGRRGGVYEEPRRVLKTVVSHYVDLKHNRERTMCLGGGAGIALLSENMRERLATIGFDVKIDDKERSFLDKLQKDYQSAIKHGVREITKTKTEIVVTTCPFVIENLSRSGIKAEHLVNLVAESTT